MKGATCRPFTFNRNNLRKLQSAHVKNRSLSDSRVSLAGNVMQTSKRLSSAPKPNAPRTFSPSDELSAHYQSAAWQRARAIRCLWALGMCECGCGQVGNSGHHVSYKRIGQWNEFMDVRWMRHECHKAQHPNKGDWTK